MATTTMTTVTNLLKEIYEDRLRDQLQSEVKSLRRIEKTSEGVTEEVGGKYVAFPIRTGRNHGIGARAENAALPTARSNTYAQARVALKYLYGSLELTGQTFELATRNPQAFASAVDEEIKGLKEGLAKDMNRQVYGGNEGVIFVISANGSTTSLVTLDGQSVEVGMFLDFWNGEDDSLNTADVEVTAKAYVPATGVYTFTVTTVTTPSAANADYVTRAGSRTNELTGFGDIIQDSGALYNVTNDIWESVENNNSGTNRPLSEGLMNKMVDDIRANGGGMPSVIFTTVGVRRAYANLLQQARRFTNTQQFTGGFSGLAFVTPEGDVPVVDDFDAPYNEMLFVNEKEIKLYQTGDWSFMARDGSMWDRVVTSSGRFDAYAANLFKYCEIGTHRRNAHGRLSDITEN